MQSTAEGGSKYEVGETSTKNQTVDGHVSEDLHIAENEDKALKRRETVTLAQDGMENEVRETYSKKQLVNNFLHFNEAVEDLRRKRENLTWLREKLQFFAEAAKRQNEKIVEVVDDWLTKADNALDDVQMRENEIKENKRFLYKMSPDWGWRYRLSKEVAKKMRTLTALASQFERVSSLAKLSGNRFFLSEGFFLFDTHLSALNRIMDALKDERVYLIGLHGEGGVGKTALAEEVEKMAKNLKLFEKVVRVDVSLKPDIVDIQNRIMKSLKSEFEDYPDRKFQIHEKLTGEKSILIIFDDVWREFDLLDFKIPGLKGDSGCKLLLTTRREKVNFTSTHSTMMVSLDRLTDDEAWYLFKLTAGLSCTSSAFNEVATEIVKESKRLPVAIQVAAKVVSGKNLEEWKDVSGNFRGKILEEVSAKIQERLEDGFRQVELGYKRLARESKLCFLLCSLFPEDYKIHIKDLMSCAIGMDLYGDNWSAINTCRNNMISTADRLRIFGLALDGGKGKLITMTKMIHKVALRIASEEKDFEIRSKFGEIEWPNNENFEHCTAISMMSTKIKELDKGFVSEKLKILLLGGDGSMTISRTSTFFEGLQALKVFILNDGLLSLGALQSLTSLRVLRLKQCKLRDISSLGMLKKLQILSFHGSDIKELPNQIGELDCLRVLDLSECQELWKIRSGVIQKLSSLEELYLGGSFENWHVEERNAEDGDASLSELKELPHLWRLSLKCRFKHLPKDFLFPKLVSNYQIAVNENGWFEYTEYSHSLKVSTTSSLNAFKELFCNVQDLHLNFITGYKNIVPSLNQRFAGSLRIFSLTCCHDMECLVDAEKNQEPALDWVSTLIIEKMTRLKELCKGRPPCRFLDTLETLSVTKCNNLIVAVTGLPMKRLEKIRVKDCGQMELVFDQMAQFSSLMCLELLNLPELRCIWNAKNVGHPSLKVVEVQNCEKLMSLFSAPFTESLSQLETLQIHGCHALKQIFPETEGNKNLRLRLPRLRTLEITDCSTLETVFPSPTSATVPDLSSGSPQAEQGFHQASELERNNIMLPQLRRFVLRSLKNLRSFCPGMHLISLPSLEELIVEECPQLTLFIIPLDESRQFHLKVLSVSKVGNSSQLVAAPVPEWDGRSLNPEYVKVGNFEELFQVAGGYFFSKLEKLVVKDLSQLTVIWKDPTQILTFQNLTYFELANCEGIRNIFSLVMARNLPQLRHLKVHECDKLEQIIIQNQDQVPASSKAHSGDIYFPSLIRMQVRKCNMLKTLFPICVANLPKLKEFEVSEASMLKQIFADEGEANIEMEVELPKLKILVLKDLPSLLSFIPAGYNFKFPSLFSPTVKNCPKISTTFLCDSNSTLRAKTNKKSQLQEDTPTIMAM